MPGKQGKGQGRSIPARDAGNRSQSGGLIETLRRWLPLPQEELVIFYTQIALLYRAAIPLARGIGILAQQTANMKMREVLLALQQTVESGHTLSEGMRQHAGVFSTLYMTLVKTGEISGTLDIMLDRAAALKEKELLLSRKVGQAATYPVIIFAFMLLFILVMGRVLMVNIIPILKSGEMKLPFITNILIMIYSFISNPFLLFISACVLCFLYWRYRKAMAAESMQLLREKFLFSLPLVGDLLKTIAFSRFCTTLSTVTESGIIILTGLILSGEASGSVLCLNYCRQMKKNVAGGGLLHESFKEFNFFSPIVLDMVRVGEESGTLPYLLAQASHLMEIQVEHSLATFTSALEPLLMAFLGIIVAFLAFAILIPLNGLISSIG